MTLVGETDLQLLEPNFADSAWMYRPDRATQNLAIRQSRVGEMSEATQRRTAMFIPIGRETEFFGRSSLG